MTQQNPWTALNIDDMEPWSVVYKVASAGAEEQVCLMPFNDAVGGRGYPVKIFIHNTTSSAATLILWDEYLGQSDPPARGDPDATGLYHFNIAASSDVSWGIDKLPLDWIQAGLCIKATQVVIIKVEFAMSNNE